jgi:hypothetical protein
MIPILARAAPKSGKLMLRIRGENTVPHPIVTEICEGVVRLRCRLSCCLHLSRDRVKMLKEPIGIGLILPLVSTVVSVCKYVPVEGAILPEECPD